MAKKGIFLPSGVGMTGRHVDQGFNNLMTTIHTRASFTNLLAGATRDGFIGGAGTAESFRKLTGVNGDMDFVLKIGRKISHWIIIFLINYI